ncbi:MAG: Ppx/GppA phosphatase family protein [Alphaproteobacteria bacterium]
MKSERRTGAVGVLPALGPVTDRVLTETTGPGQRFRKNAARALGRWPHTYSALDLGTNNCRLLIAKPTRRGFRVVDAFSRIVRLGEGLGQSGELSEAAMDRAISALKICAKKMQRRGVSRAHNVATAACRQAANGAAFAATVLAETGIELSIISPAEEARLAVAGCLPLLDHTSRYALVFDVGGGSTELIWLDQSNRRNPNILAWTSMAQGVVSLSEKHGGLEISRQSYEAMVAEVREQLQGFEREHNLRRHIDAQEVQLLGMSGTVTTLAGVHMGLRRYDRNLVDGVWVSVPEMRAVARQLSEMDYPERVAVPCIGQDRADLVVAGCAILEAITDLWPAKVLRVADRGLREGILTMLMRQDDRPAIAERQGSARPAPL